MPTHTAEQLVAACNAFFTALASNASSFALLAHFSTTHPVFVQHYASTCSHPLSSLLRGPNAIRSYFDLLATHWTRSNLRRHSTHADPAAHKVVTTASIVWTWRKSGRSWTEDFTCTLGFDDTLGITGFVIRTESSPSTCVMRAVDADPPKTPQRPSSVQQVSLVSPLYLFSAHPTHVDPCPDIALRPTTLGLGLAHPKVHIGDSIPIFPLPVPANSEHVTFCLHTASYSTSRVSIFISFSIPPGQSPARTNYGHDHINRNPRSTVVFLLPR